MIELNLVEPGMELASDAVAPNGFVLLPADAVITAKHLQSSSRGESVSWM